VRILVADISRLNNDGTPQGAVPISNGKYFGGYYFDGLDDYLEVPDNSEYSPYGDGSDNGQLSAFAWIKPAYAPSSGYTQKSILFKGATGNFEWELRQNNDDLIFTSWSTGGGQLYYVANGWNVLTTEWQYVGFVLDYKADSIGGSVNVYHNGKIIATDTTNATDILVDGTASVFIGERTDQTGYNFNGTIDEVMIMKRKLTTAEVEQFYFSNLYKYTSTQWALEVNQSHNITTTLSDGKYTYQAFVEDIDGNKNQTDLRQIIIRSDCTYVSGQCNFIIDWWRNCTFTSDITIDDGCSVTLDGTTDGGTLSFVNSQFKGYSKFNRICNAEN